MEAGRVWYDLRASFNSLCSGMNSLLPGHRVLLCCQKWVHWRWVGGAARRASSITFPPRRTPDGKRKTVSSLQQNTFTFWAWLQYFSSFPGMSLWLKASSLIPRGMTSCQQPHRHVVLRNDSLWMRACSCSCSPVPVVAAKPNLFAAEYSTWSSMHICPATQCMRTLISFSHTHIHTSS